MYLLYLLWLQADCGGLCSPASFTYVSHSKDIIGDVPAALACKRIILDEALVRVAERQVLVYNYLLNYTN